MINIEKAISWFYERLGKVTYSMSRRTGPKSYDCSSSVYYALVSGGASEKSYPVSTETAHDWLVKNGYELIAENKPWQAKRGDITIWGKRGYSSGANGHIMLWVDSEKVIHCNYNSNGISIDNHDIMWASYKPYFYTYRLKKVTDKKGWIKDDVGWWYRKADNTYFANKWFLYNDNWYYFDNFGYMLSEKWLLYKDKWYFFDKDGKMVSKSWQKIGNEIFFLNSWGVCELNYIKEIDGKTYAFDSRGALITDKKINSSGEII